jgi:hypothetical protein
MKAVFLTAALLIVSAPLAAQTASPAAQKKPAEPAKDRSAVFCKWKGSDFSQGASFCVFANRALVCDGGVWKQENNQACVATPSVLP